MKKKLMKAENQSCNSFKRNYKRFLLLTLARADQNEQREAITKQEIALRISKAPMAITTIIVAV